MIDKLLELEADKQAAIDNEVEDKGEETGDLLYDLATDPSERDTELWTMLGARPDLAMQDFFTVPVAERDTEWHDAFAAMLSASLYQAFLEIYGLEFLESVERRNGRIASVADGMNKPELQQAGKQGFGKQSIQTARERRRAVS